MKKSILIGVGIVVVVAAGIIAASSGNGSEAQTVSWPSGSILPEGPMFHDWESINIKGGNVEHTFTLKNNSSEPLQIKTASTSCMCTTAYIDVDGETSPVFGMHNNSSNWGKVVSTGKTFTVRMIFDPLAHGPNAVGPIQRSVFIETSAVPDGKYAQADTSTDGSILELRASGNVMYEDEYMEAEIQAQETYEYTLRDFLFEETEVDFGVVKQSAGIQTHDFNFQYVGENPVTITGIPGSCACTTAEASVTKLENGGTGVITLLFDPNLHEEPEGKFFKTISVLTDPAQEETVELKMWAEIDLDLGTQAYKLQEHED